MSQTTLPSAGRSDDVEVPAPEAPARPSAVGARSPTLTAVALPLAALTIVSLALRLPGMGISMWIDEGLSVGIASRPWSEIPGVLVRDGSPPLYYLALHGWMEVFGRSVEAVRALSLVFATITVPVAFWAGDRLFGRRSGWIAAVLAASSSYLTVYAREGRMYSLMVLLTLVCVTAFVRAVALGHRRSLPVFVVALALLLYTHNWGLYVGVGLALAAVVGKRLTSGDDGITWKALSVSFGAVALLYVPWLPTLAAQAAHTGAPWSAKPDLGDLVGVIPTVIGDRAAGLVLLVTAVPALAAVVRVRSAPGRVIAVLSAVALGSLLVAWVASQLEPAWASRYLGIVLAPVLLVAAAGLALDGKRGVLALGVVALLWVDVGDRVGLFGPPSIPRKSNVGPATTVVDDLLEPGDVVVSTHMEQVPLLRYYLGDDLRYADPLGLVDDPQVVDWRDALARVEAATPEQGLVPLVDDMAEGDRLVLACARLSPTSDKARLRLPWFKAMVRNCTEWRSTLDADPAMELVKGPVAPPPRQASGSSMFLLVYEKHR
ncbi:MAG: glycosyltransferase family 39 protein [Actinomycetota bacterium]|nr:glycosyltransferase family 39 protein [Actinomycetota bacterium]